MDNIVVVVAVVVGAGEYVQQIWIPLLADSVDGVDP